jgi:hypothetical protein
MKQFNRLSSGPHFVQPTLDPLIFTILNPLRLDSPYTMTDLRRASIALARHTLNSFQRYGIKPRECCLAMGLRQVPHNVEPPEAVTAIAKIFELMQRCVDTQNAMGVTYDDI